jgi:hypothetical protein
MHLEPNLDGKVLIKDTEAANLSYRGRIGCGAVMVTINSAIIVSRFTPASTHILGAFSSAMLATAIVGQSAYYVRWLLLFKNIVDALLSFAPIKAKKPFYSLTHTSAFMFYIRGKKGYLRKRKIHYAFAIATCLVR